MSPDCAFMLGKAKQYCDYSERCIEDVKEKLKSWSAHPDIIDKVIHQLEKENYIDEDRYVRTFALSKLRHNNWGRNKILAALRQKKIPDLIIQIGLQEIEGEEYLSTLKKILSSKKIDEKNPQIKKTKLAQYAIQKGFQPSIVWQVINQADK